MIIKGSYYELKESFLEEIFGLKVLPFPVFLINK